MKIRNLNARLKRSIKSHWRASVSTVLLLLSLSAAAVWYGCTPNTAARLWGVDDTTWVTYAKNMDGTGPTADHPVYIEAQAERLYGLKIGTPMRVHYIIKTTSDVKPQFDTLMQGVLLHYKSPWRLVARPQPPSHDTKDGITTWDLEVTVAVWEPPSVDGEPGKPIDFIEPPNADPAPAKAAEPGAEQPAKADLSGAPPESSANQSAEPRLWPFKLEFLVLSGKPIKRQYIETPPLNFGFSSLVEPDAQKHGLGFGSLDDVPARPNRVGLAIVGLGFAIACGGVIYLIRLTFFWWKRFKEPLPVPEDVIMLRQSMDEAERAKHARLPLEQLRIAVRSYLGGATLTDEHLIELWVDHPEQETVREVLGILSRAALSGLLGQLDEEKVKIGMEQLIASRLHVDRPLSRWSRLRASIQAKASRLGRVVPVHRLPFRRVTGSVRWFRNVPSALRKRMRRSRI